MLEEFPKPVQWPGYVWYLVREGSATSTSSNRDDR